MIMGIGIHVIDSAHQFMGLHKASAAVAAGGIYAFPTDATRPIRSRWRSSTRRH